MNSAHPINDKAGAPGTGTSIIAIGAFPAKLATVTAEVLAQLLAGKKLTSLDGVYGASTTRIAALIYHLDKEHGWVINREVKMAGCKDGRIASVMVYFLDPEVISRAMAAGGAEWRLSVISARALLRTKAHKAFEFAAFVNAKKGELRRHLGKVDLFDGEGPPAMAGA